MQRILSHMRKAIEDYNMIEENDKIAICLSGGKDSITLLHAFKVFFPPKVLPIGQYSLTIASIFP